MIRLILTYQHSTLFRILLFLRAERGRVSEARALYLRCQAGLKVVFGVQHDRYRKVTSALESLNTAGNVV